MTPLISFASWYNPFSWFKQQIETVPVEIPKPLVDDTEKENSNPKKKVNAIQTIRNIQDFLASIESIHTINNLNVEGREDYIILIVDFEAGGGGINVKGVVTVNLENKGDSIGVKNYTVEAGFFDKNIINFFIKPELEELPEKIKKYAEEKEGRKVEKIEIQNGEFKVTF
jgi:hypothetical protein